MVNLNQFISETLRRAGEVAKEGFQKVSHVKIKEDQSHVLTEKDIESEKVIISEIAKNFPSDSIIAEESGFVQKSSNSTWIVDPIDGTSNFAAGIPWFAIMISKLVNWIPVVSGIYLPVQKEMYYAEKDQGAFCNGKKIRVTQEPDLKNVLVTFGIDYSPDVTQLDKDIVFVKKLIQCTRNARSSGCSGVDFAYLASGRLGGCSAHTSKIWDNAPGMLLTTEAGGVYTDLFGNSVDFTSTKDNFVRNFAYVASTPLLHPQLLK